MYLLNVFRLDPVAVVIAFFICWAPFHAQRLLYVYGKGYKYYREVNEKMYYIAGCFYYFSATINPILYNVMSSRYRQAFCETLCGCHSRRRHYNNGDPSDRYLHYVHRFGLGTAWPWDRSSNHCISLTALVTESLCTLCIVIALYSGTLRVKSGRAG